MATIRDLAVQYQNLPKGLQNAVDYWQTLKGGRLGPAWPEIDMLKLPMELLPTTVVVDCFTDKDGPNFCYRYYGSGLRNIHGVELTGKTPGDVPVPELARYIKEEFLRVVETKAPVFSAYKSDTFEQGGDFLNVVRLPISEDGQNVTGVLAVISYRQHNQALTKMFEEINAG